MAANFARRISSTPTNTQIQQMEAAFAARSTEDWLKRLEELDVPSVPVVLTEEVFDSEQSRANEVFHRMPHPIAGEIVQPRSPVHMRNVQVGAGWHAPRLGVDAPDVLGRAGYDNDRVRSLVESGVLRILEGES